MAGWGGVRVAGFSLLNRTHPVLLQLNKRKKDKMPVETQLIFFSIGFGYMFRIEPIHHQALIQKK